MSYLGFNKLITQDETITEYSNSYKRSGYINIENKKDLIIRRLEKQYSVYDNFRLLDTFGSFEDAQNYIIMFDNAMV